MRTGHAPTVVALLAGAVAIFGWALEAGVQSGSAATVECADGTMIALLPELHEASGLARARRTPDLFWSHNDSGDAAVTGLGSDGRVRARVRLAGARVYDWEAVAVGACPQGHCLFIGDIGDNAGWRRFIVVYRTPEPVPGMTTTEVVDAFRGVYPEGPQDAEALFVVDGTVFIVTKGRQGPVRLYRFPRLQPSTTVSLELVATLSSAAPEARGRVTDATVSPDGRWVALRTLDRLVFYEANALLAGRPGDAHLAFLQTLRERQGEGLAWAESGTIYLAGEGRRGGTFARVSCTLPR